MNARLIRGIRVAQWLFLLLTLAFIWGNSCIPVAVSDEQSKTVTEHVKPQLEAAVGKGKVTNQLVRKLAHFTEFAALGFQILLLRRENTPLSAARAAELGFFAAFSDESIQVLSNRGAQITDVWLDTAGVAFGVLAALLLRFLYLRLRRKKE
ncbi:MAG: VanZ family protein [Ruminococcaceae bacterium]|jgi:VanZ family protein|nr:VanZ family protein [Oscillospiraceae bacterium]